MLQPSEENTDNVIESQAQKAGARNAARDLKRIQSMHDNSVDLGAVCQSSKGAYLPSVKSVDGNALKTISSTDTELRVGNYLVLFGGRDLEGIASPRKNRDGSTGEYFTKATEFDSAYTDIGFLYVDWEHGQAPYDEPQKDDVLGYVDWKSARIDERGVFVERVLNRRNRYVQFLSELIDAGLIGNSSEAVSGDVEKTDDGAIKRWPLRRDTLTVSPMDSRMITGNQLAAVKALSAKLPGLKSFLPAEPESNAKAAGPEAGGTPAATVAEDDEEAERTNTAQRLLLELELLLIE